MRKRKLGRNGPDVSVLALGCMGMAGGYGPADDAESVATIRAALDAGMNYIDTGDFYGHGHAEMVLREALKGRARESAFISVKFGAQRGPDGTWYGYDHRPAVVKTALAYTLKRIGTDYIDLYQPARLDPAVPIEETVGAIADLIKQGYVRHIGLSEVGPQTIRRAHAAYPIAALQIEYSLMSRGIERAILPTLRELGIALSAYGVLSRGLISDTISADTRPPGEIRGRMPRFLGDNLARNVALVEKLRTVAKDKGCTVVQLAFAWVLAQGDDVFPLVGARRRDQLDNAIKAVDIKLSAEDLKRIEQAMPADAVAGERYGAGQLATLDSEQIG